MNILWVRTLALGLGLLSVGACADNEMEKANADLDRLVQQYDQVLVPMRLAYQQHSFWAATRGQASDYERVATLKTQQADFFANQADFETVQRLVQQQPFADPTRKRLLQLLYYEYLQHPFGGEQRAQAYQLETQLAQLHANYRASVGGQALNVAQLRAQLASTKDPAQAEALWKAAKALGPSLAPKLIQLVKLRNAAARKLGFDNYYEMQLAISDLDTDYLSQVLDEIDLLTRGPYTQLKAEIDQHLCQWYGIQAPELRPWHYQDLFFQNPPTMLAADYDAFYQQQSIPTLGRRFFESLGFAMDSLMQHADFDPRPNKTPFNTVRPFDLEGDVRLSINLHNDEYSMSQCLYEMSYALYLQNISTELPYLFRRAPQLFVVDAVAMLLSSSSTHPAWIGSFHKLNPEQSALLLSQYTHYQRLRKFVFARWVQVVYRFERSLYQNPDQDLNTLWWDLVENYQLLQRPQHRNQPDWATKEHFATQPASYHNYLLGELFASQLLHHLQSSVLPKSTHADSLYVLEQPAVGEYLRVGIFAHGASLPWQELLLRATGEDLNPDYFYQQMVQ